VHFRPRLKLYNTLGAFFCPSVTAKPGLGLTPQRTKANPSSQAGVGRRETPVFQTCFGGAAIQGNVGRSMFPLDRHASLAMTAVPRRLPWQPTSARRARHYLAGCAFSAATPSLQYVGRLFLQLRNRQGGVGSTWSAQSAAGLPLPRFTTGGCFPRLGFSSSFKLSEGLAPFVALDLKRFARTISTDSFGRRLRNGWIQRGVVPARLPGRGQTESARTCRKITSASFSPNAFRAYSQRTGASPSFLRRLATPACFEPILRLPFFEVERPFVGAHRRAAIQ